MNVCCPGKLRDQKFAPPLAKLSIIVLDHVCPGRAAHAECDALRSRTTADKTSPLARSARLEAPEAARCRQGVAGLSGNDFAAVPVIRIQSRKGAAEIRRLHWRCPAGTPANRVKCGTARQQKPGHSPDLN